MRLFISYAHVDKPLIKDWIVDKLVAGGHHPWFDERLVAGQSWKQQLSERIERCDAFVYCMTPESITSDWCQWELAYAVELGKSIVPVLLQAETQLPEQLAKLQYVDFSDGPTGDAVARLMGGLQNLTAEQIPPAPDDPKGPPAQMAKQENGSNKNFRKEIIVAVIGGIFVLIAAFIQRPPDPPIPVTPTLSLLPTDTNIPTQTTVMDTPTIGVAETQAVAHTNTSSIETSISEADDNSTLVETDTPLPTVNAADAVSIEFVAEEEILTIVISPTNANPLDDMYFIHFDETSGSDETTSLESLSNNLRSSSMPPNFPQGVCLILRTSNSDGISPSRCNNVGDTVLVEVASNDVFWYNDFRREKVNFRVGWSDLDSVEFCDISVDGYCSLSVGA
jgi:hypothetical protein